MKREDNVWICYQDSQAVERWRLVIMQVPDQGVVPSMTSVLQFDDALVGDWTHVPTKSSRTVERHNITHILQKIFLRSA